jgi:hypothetical protein
MTTVTLKVDTTENAELLVKLLAWIDFITKIDTLDDVTDFTPEQIAVLDERLEAIERGEVKHKTLEELRNAIKEKHGI